MTTSTGPEQRARVPNVAAGNPPINTDGEPGGNNGPQHGEQVVNQASP